nr:epimerase family protein SDR39U1 isoform X2 [Osmia lignaria]
MLNGCNIVTQVPFVIFVLHHASADPQRQKDQALQQLLSRTLSLQLTMVVVVVVVVELRANSYHSFRLTLLRLTAIYVYDVRTFLPKINTITSVTLIQHFHTRCRNTNGGGTGFIGRQIINSLTGKGVSHTCISRMPGPNRISWHDLECYGLPENTTAVINVAGQNVLDPKQRWSEGFKQNVINSRVKTTKLLAEAIINTKADAFLTISGVAYYKPNNIEYTEESECEKYDFLSELCHDWERAAQLPKDSATRQVIIRSGVVLGKDGGMIKQIYLPFFIGLGGPIGNGNQYMPWIHVTDLIITNKEFTKVFASTMRRPAVIPIPRVALNILFNKERAKIMLEGQKVVPKRVKELGFRYQFPDIQSACAEILVGKSIGRQQ